MVNFVEYGDNVIKDYGSPQQQKNAVPFKEFAKMGSPNKESEDCVSTVIWQPHSPPTKYQASSSNTSWSSIRSRFVDMGYSSALVEKAIRIHGTENEEDILEYVLACQAADYSSESSDSGHGDSNAVSERSECDDMYNFWKSQENNQKHVTSSQIFKETQLGNSQEDDIKIQLLEMGYSEIEVSSAIDINGINTPIVELVDFIEVYLHWVERNEDMEAIIENFTDKGMEVQDEEPYSRKFCKRKQADIISNGSKAGSFSVEKKAHGAQQNKLLKNKKVRERVQFEQVQLIDKNVMVRHSSRKGLGFGVPLYPVGRRSKELKPFIHGPPFFYFENVAIAPKDVWKTISRHLGSVEPEFVDSRFFSASRRQRGYVHNLPVDGRFQVLPLPPMTIHEALPQTITYWPPWDDREKLNCICTGRGSDVLCEELRSIMRDSHGNPTLPDQAYILENCKKWNLVWVGPGQMAPLEPNEIELFLGFERDHTRGASSRTYRLHCLGNAFQTDTVAYHLSVLKPLYPDGLKVLSLFSGIGGAEVALYRIGIHLKCVVAVETCPHNRFILSSWWKKTGQTGRLIEKEDVQHLTRDELEELVDTVGGFDLIIGGSPCNNLSGNNRVSRSGLEGKHSAVFYEFSRIWNEVTQIMHSRGMMA